MESVIEFKLPALGENIEEGDLVRLMIAPGAMVNEGQSVMELETDKAVVEVPSSVSGSVKEILVKEGDKIKVGQVIFTAESNRAAAAAAEGASRVVASTKSAPPVQSASSGQAKPQTPAPQAPPPPASPVDSRGAQVANSIDGCAALRIPAAGTWREHFRGRTGAADDCAGGKGLRRPAGHGTRN